MSSIDENELENAFEQVPDGVEVRIHDVSLREVKALEEAERDRRLRLEAASRFAPSSEAAHAHDEAKALLKGLEETSAFHTDQEDKEAGEGWDIEEEPPRRISNVLRRLSLTNVEEDERDRRTSVAVDVAYGTILNAHNQAQAFLDGIQCLDDDRTPAIRTLNRNRIDAQEWEERQSRLEDKAKIAHDISHGLKESQLLIDGHLQNGGRTALGKHVPVPSLPRSALAGTQLNVGKNTAAAAED
ncbi:uncharacterized protein EV422DRAFT_311409 [Fimicolochytrium jonesii]|uniref:uncharacterized protein n=1 Tax=Fimicolochytrium jonesii TaxID=1396493 RepID=UPI0022FE45C5|nr:uncharacterized protein EV422DRAFT_311409 [Fimicolochytrium jonesii]KAI8824208.1 hypothetical protein EV422DRAFT_311409 [Fimicolochytrium jonesii]